MISYTPSGSGGRYGSGFLHRRVAGRGRERGRAHRPDHRVEVGPRGTGIRQHVVEQHRRVYQAARRRHAQPAGQAGHAALQQGDHEERHAGRPDVRPGAGGGGARGGRQRVGGREPARRGGRVGADDGVAAEVMSCGGIVEGDVRGLMHGCIFTRGPKDLKNTAGFIGGSDMAAGERLLAAAQQAFFGPFRVSLMLDSNGSNTTAVAAVEKMVRTAGEVRGQRVLIVAGTGPVGIRAAGLFARAGAEVVITSRKPEAGERARDLVVRRFGGTVRAVTLPDASQALRACERATLLLNAGPAGVMLVPKQAWANRPGLKVVADVNAVPPLGIEGVDVMDDGVTKDGVRCFGALAIGHLKMKLHKACIARLFERNDLVLDAETIADVARELSAQPK